MRATGHSAYVAQCTRLEHARADPVPQQRDDGDHAEQVEGERAETEPERLVGAQEREDEVDEPELGVGVEVAAVPTWATTSPVPVSAAVRCRSLVPKRPSHGTGRPERATMPRTSETVKSTRATTPVPRPRAQKADAHAATSWGQAPTRTTRCRWSTRRAV